MHWDGEDSVTWSKSFGYLSTPIPIRTANERIAPLKSTWASEAFFGWLVAHISFSRAIRFWTNPFIEIVSASEFEKFEELRNISSMEPFWGLYDQSSSKVFEAFLFSEHLPFGSSTCPKPKGPWRSEHERFTSCERFFRSWTNSEFLPLLDADLISRTDCRVGGRSPTDFLLDDILCPRCLYRFFDGGERMRSSAPICFFLESETGLFKRKNPEKFPLLPPDRRVFPFPTGLSDLLSVHARGYSFSSSLDVSTSRKRTFDRIRVNLLRDLFSQWDAWWATPVGEGKPSLSTLEADIGVKSVKVKFPRVIWIDELVFKSSHQTKRIDFLSLEKSRLTIRLMRKRLSRFGTMN